MLNGLCKLKYELQKDSDMPEKDELLLVLKTIGFSDCEARIYLAVLELKEALPSSISKRLKLKRPSVYVILERLEGKGLLYAIKKTDICATASKIRTFLLKKK